MEYCFFPFQDFWISEWQVRGGQPNIVDTGFDLPSWRSSSAWCGDLLPHARPAPVN
jgi:hypothetical protein